MLTFSFFLSGMTSKVFENIPSVLEIGCSGRTLETTADVFMMTLYTHPGRDVIASINLRQKKCVTFGRFTSCEIDENDSRRSEVKTLITNLQVGEEMQLGCNVAFAMSGWSENVEWSLDVRRNSKFYSGTCELRSLR